MVSILKKTCVTLFFQVILLLTVCAQLTSTFITVPSFQHGVLQGTDGTSSAVVASDNGDLYVTGVDNAGSHGLDLDIRPTMLTRYFRHWVCDKI